MSFKKVCLDLFSELCGGNDSAIRKNTLTSSSTLSMSLCVEHPCPQCRDQEKQQILSGSSLLFFCCCFFCSFLHPRSVSAPPDRTACTEHLPLLVPCCAYLPGQHIPACCLSVWNFELQTSNKYGQLMRLSQEALSKYSLYNAYLSDKPWGWGGLYLKKIYHAWRYEQRAAQHYVMFFWHGCYDADWPLVIWCNSNTTLTKVNPDRSTVTI